MTKSLCILIVNFHSESLVIPKIRELSSPNIEFVIVDNSNTFNFADYSYRFRVIRPGANVGFGAAVNLGLSVISTDYVVILNPDVIVDLASIMALVNAADVIPNLGALAPRLREKKHQGPFLNGGFMPSLWRTFCHFSFLSRYSSTFPIFRGIYAHDLVSGRGKNLPVEWISGALMVVKTDTIKSIGGFSEDWFMYSEDLEFCLRLSQHKKDLFIDLEVSAEHIGQASDTRNFGVSRQSVLWLVNLADFHFRYIASRNRLLHMAWCGIVCVGFFERAIIDVLRAGKSTLLLRGTGEIRFREFALYAKTAGHMAFENPKFLRQSH